MNKLHAHHDLVGWRFAEYEGQLHFYKQLPAVVGLLAKVDGRSAIKHHCRRINPDSKFRAAMRQNRLIHHGIHIGILLPVVGHRRQDLDEYSAMQHFATRRHTDRHSRRVAKNTASARERKRDCRASFSFPLRRAQKFPTIKRCRRFRIAALHY